MAKHIAQMPPYIVINRTFYPAAKGLGQHLAAYGWLYQDDEDNIFIAGNRFHLQRLLHIPYFSGDAYKALSFAHELAIN